MRRPLLLLCLPLLLASVGASAAEAREAAFREERFERTPRGWERVRAASEALLGAPYLLSPLGEGEGPDADPRFRLDAFDCLTFVETALALGYAGSLEEARVLLDELRYEEAAGPAFETRLHLMEAQWIPAQIRRGLLHDVTARFGGDDTVEIELAYDESIWKKRPRSLREVPFRESIRGNHKLPMIPMERALQLAETLPEGLVLNVVRSAREDRMFRITHTGLLVIVDGKRYVRHASLGQAKVVDEPVQRFLRRHAGMRRWKVDGIHLLAISDAPAHEAALRTAVHRPGEEPTESSAPR